MNYISFGVPEPRPVVHALSTKKTLIMAWAVEIACVAMGLTVALVVGFETGGVWAGIIAAAPFVAATAVELSRIPLVRGFFVVRGLVWKVLALGMILLAGALTAENLIFGFERAFSLRIEEARVKTQAVVIAQAKAQDLSNNLAKNAADQEQKNKELQVLATRETQLVEAAQKRSDGTKGDGQQAHDDTAKQLDQAEKEQALMQARHQKDQETMWRACRADRQHCGWTAMKRRQESEVAALAQWITDLRVHLQKLSDGQASEQEEVRKQLARDIRDIHKQEGVSRRDLKDLQGQEDGIKEHLAEQDKAVLTAKGDAESVRRRSQMHRLAQFFFGTSDDAAAMRVLTWFSLIAALVLGSAGSVLAATYFRSVSQPVVPPTNRLVRALRGWIARRRKKHSVVKTVEVEREVPGPERIVEKEVEVVREVPGPERIVEKEVEVVREVPVDRIVMVDREVPVERIVEKPVEVVREVPVERVVEKKVEVIKPELVLVPVPLEASEEVRRRILDAAAAEHGLETVR